MKTAEEKRRERKIKGLIAVIVIIVIMTVCGCGATSEGEGKTEQIGIRASDVEVEYDGLPHGIEIENTEGGDRITYAATKNGVYAEERIAYVWPGEYTVYYRVERKGYAVFMSEAKITIKKTVLKDIGVKTSKYIYDGEAHGIILEGTEKEDIIRYSENGTEFYEELEKREVGEYVIYYRAERSYGEYASSCVLTILPDLRGKYVSKTGIEEITGMTYDVDGNGKDYTCDGQTLKKNGEIYERVKENEKIYKIKANGKYVYVKGGAEIEVTAEFGNGTAIIKVNDKEEIVVQGNYCENGEYDYVTGKAKIRVSGSEEVTEKEIEISTRAKRQIADIRQTVEYDGQAHSPQVEYENVLYLADGIYTKEIPEFTEPGIHKSCCVAISEEYLPAYFNVTVEIAPSISGIYYNANGYIEISAVGAKVNGIWAEIGYEDGAWSINGKEAETTETGLKIGGEEYKRHETGKLIAVEYNGTPTVTESESESIEIEENDGRVTVRIDGEAIAEYECGEITVTVNGTEITARNESGVNKYILGRNELNHDVIRIVIVDTGRRAA